MSDADDILASGRASAYQLSQMFRRNKNNMARYLDGLPPVGKRKGVSVYDISEAAAMLVPPGYEIEPKIRGMNQADLPPLLSKEFWNGQRARMQHERELGNLWPTEDVQALVAAVLQAVSINQRLMLDNVERQAGTLTPAQRSTIARISEGTVNATREAIIERCADWPAPQDNVSLQTGDEPTSQIMATGKWDAL